MKYPKDILLSETDEEFMKLVSSVIIEYPASKDAIVALLEKI